MQDDDDWTPIERTWLGMFRYFRSIGLKPPPPPTARLFDLWLMLEDRPLSTQTDIEFAAPDLPDNDTDTDKE